MKKLLFLSIVLQLQIFSFSQEVKNVVAVFDGEKIIITYDLSENQPNTTFDVTVICYNFYDDTMKMNNKTGDFGQDVKAGKNKGIVWYIQKDYRKIKSVLYFVIDAIVHEPYSSTPETNIPENMVFVEGGAFQMGQPNPNIGGDGNSDDEQPVHSVTVSDFILVNMRLQKRNFVNF
jgi:formylglycine-generating enzyme required for sulfatase activity